MPKTSPSILIVDDNLGARRSIEGLLGTEGYQLTLAESGFEALDILEGIQPDLILLDVMMPGMNGFEVCQRIRSSPRLTEVPIIMITALDDDESMLKGIDAGADDFLSKPINKLELRSRVRGITRLNRYRKLCGERQKFEWVVENSTFGFITVDKDDQILFSNPRAREILDFHDDPLKFYDQITQKFNPHPDDFSSIWNESVASFEPMLFVKPQSKDSPTQWVKATVLNLDQIESRQRLIKLEDISYSMRSFQEKQTFSRMISHKMLTPLNALKAAQQMLSVSKSSSSEELINRVSDLQKQGLERLEYDIDSIVRFLDSSNSNLGDDRSSIDQLSNQLKQIGEESQLPFSLEVEIGDSGSKIVRISKESLEACIREIVENAFKYHPKNSPSLDCRISVENTSGMAVILFQNDGAHLSEEEIANAWKPYWQSDRYLTGEVKGMGLGLSMIASHIWSAGGSCKISNRQTTTGISIELKLPTYETE